MPKVSGSHDRSAPLSALLYRRAAGWLPGSGMLEIGQKFVDGRILMVLFAEIWQKTNPEEHGNSMVATDRDSGMLRLARRTNSPVAIP